MQCLSYPMTFILHAAGCVEAQNNQLNAERARFGLKLAWRDFLIPGSLFVEKATGIFGGIGDFMVYFDIVYQGTVPRR